MLFFKSPFSAPPPTPHPSIPSLFTYLAPTTPPQHPASATCHDQQPGSAKSSQEHPRRSQEKTRENPNTRRGKGTTRSTKPAPAQRRDPNIAANEQQARRKHAASAQPARRERIRRAANTTQIPRLTCVLQTLCMLCYAMLCMFNFHNVGPCAELALAPELFSARACKTRAKHKISIETWKARNEKTSRA